MKTKLSSTISQNKDTKRLLCWLILVSLLIHIPIYLHMNGLLTTEVLQYIDLTVRSGEDITSRKRLRPPPIVKKRGKATNATASLMTPIQVPESNHLYNAGDTPVSASLPNTGIAPLPSMSKMNVASYTDDSSFEKIGSGASLSSIGLGGGGGGLTREDYIEMVRLKVERHNKSPMDSTRTGGVVTVQFVINLDGTIQQLHILIPSQKEVFNNQALKAVRESAPFKKPPPSIFSGPVPIKIDFYFRLR